MFYFLFKRVLLFKKPQCDSPINANNSTATDLGLYLAIALVKALRASRKFQVGKFGYNKVREKKKKVVVRVDEGSDVYKTRPRTVRLSALCNKV